MPSDSGAELWSSQGYAGSVPPRPELPLPAGGTCRLHGASCSPLPDLVITDAAKTTMAAAALLLLLQQLMGSPTLHGRSPLRCPDSTRQAGRIFNLPLSDGLLQPNALLFWPGVPGKLIVCQIQIHHRSQPAVYSS